MGFKNLGFTQPSIYTPKFNESMNDLTKRLVGGVSKPIQQDAPTPQVAPTGSLPTNTGTPLNSQQTPQGASLVDFQRVMRAVAQTTYEGRQKREGKITGGQFDPGKVSGSTFKDIINFTESNRGGDISKMYSSGMEAGTEAMKQEEAKRQFDIEQAQKKEVFYADHPELNYGFSTADGLRTDRHNNPTAFTIDIARQAGLVEGIDYVKGDPFPNNPNLFTAKLLGNPIEITMRVINKIGFMTQSGQTRWTYTDSIPGANNNDWGKLSFEEKTGIIKNMYRFEGGNGSLFGIKAGEQKLSTEKATFVRQVAGGFDNETQVKQFQQLQEANTFIKSMDPNTTNPADDQGIIYAFAKSMDPNSVVREGEYATVQKYAQSWASTFGFNAQRVVDGVEFLTPAARENMRSTVQKKFDASKKSYDKIYGEYVRRINEVGNINDGEKYLTQYSFSTITNNNANEKEVSAAKSKYGIDY